jgi:hypothetical protein
MGRIHGMINVLNGVYFVGIAFVLCCVWLIVRLVNRRERWVKLTLAIVVGLPVLYVTSFGPWCWAMSRWGMDEDDCFACGIYVPLVEIWNQNWNHPTPPGAVFLRWYGNLFADHPIDPAADTDSDQWFICISPFSQ